MALSTLQACYRQLAKRLHPDRARDAADAAARTEVMQVVNRLRDAGNLAALQAMLEGLNPSGKRAASAAKLRAADVNARYLQRAVLTEDGWVCPPR